MAFFQKLAWLVAIIGLATELVLYQPAPTHNPFDDVFNVSRERLLREGYTEQAIECGYVNVNKQVAPGLKVHYQFFFDEPYVLMKGFDLSLDSVPCLGEDSLSLATARAQLDARLQSPAGLAALTKTFYSLQIADLEVIKDEEGFTYLLFSYPGASNWEREKMYVGCIKHGGKAYLEIQDSRSKPDNRKLLAERLANWWRDWRDQYWPESPYYGEGVILAPVE
jgi:hypothetical protein